MRTKEIKKQIISQVQQFNLHGNPKKVAESIYNLITHNIKERDWPIMFNCAILSASGVSPEVDFQISDINKDRFLEMNRGLAERNPIQISESIIRALKNILPKSDFQYFMTNRFELLAAALFHPGSNARLTRDEIEQINLEKHLR